MSMFYNMPFKQEVPLYAGLGVSKLIGDKLAELGCKKVMLIMDKGVEASGVPQKIIDLIKAKGIEVITNSDVLADPPDTRIDEIAAKAKAANIDGVVAMGGGSSMDTAKATKLLLKNEGHISDYYDFTVPQKPSVPLICIPTTSGTGSEANPFVVTTDTKTGLKVALGGLGCMPTMSLVDAELLTGIPKAVTASCAFDALAHLIDGIFSIWTDGITQNIAIQGIRLIRKSLLTAYNNGQNVKARHDLHMASVMGGIVINSAMCNVAHAFGHSLGALYHTPHGVACAIFTPASLEFLATVAPDEAKLVADAFDIEYDDNTPVAEIARKTAQVIYEFGKLVNIPDLKDILPNKEDAYKMIPLVPPDINCATSPKIPTEEEAKSIIDRTYEYAVADSLNESERKLA